MAKRIRIALGVALVGVVAIGVVALIVAGLGSFDDPGGPPLQVLLRRGQGGGGVSGQIIVKKGRGGLVASTSVRASGKTFSVGPGRYVVVGISDTGHACGPTRVEVGSDPQTVYVACR